ncbi:KDEL motif-containing protein 1, partial [Eurytemora carolleeae]|uniref:KDEL motif-containing protein 1 n=1 Tax=Eurytemora carolleeae TaxID=1294199 RepID=UPI000C77D615
MYLYLFMLMWLNCYVFSTKVWGPGLNPSQISLPCRYFFVQLEDEAGVNITTKLEDSIEVLVEGDNTAIPFRAFSEIFNKNNGFFIVRYKVYHACDNVRIQVLVNGSLVYGPIYVQGTVQPDHCNCPEGDLSSWYKMNK